MTDAIVMPMPTSAATMIVRTCEHGLGVGESGPGGVESTISSRATATPPRTPEHRRQDAERRGPRREIIRRTWRPDAPTARSKREFAQPLADRDLEHVVDDERARRTR